MAVCSHLVIKLSAPYPVSAATSPPQEHGDTALKQPPPHFDPQLCRRLPNSDVHPLRYAKHSWENWHPAMGTVKETEVVKCAARAKLSTASLVSLQLSLVELW